MPDPTPDQINNLYEAAPQINAAVSSILTAAGLTCYTPASPAELQKARSRVEIDMQVSGEKQSYHVFDDGTKRNATFTGQIQFSIIAPTAGDDPTQIFTAYQAMLAWKMSNIVEALNGVDDAGARYLPYHQIQRMTGTSYAQQFPFDKGFLLSKPIYAVEFGIIRTAWAEVGLTPV